MDESAADRPAADRPDAGEPRSAHAGTSTRGTVLGGVLVTISGVLALLGAVDAHYRIDDTYTFPFAGTIARWAASLLLLIGLAVAVAGPRRGADVVGGSLVGQIALVGVGAIDLLTRLTVAAGLQAQLGALLSLLAVVVAIAAALAVRRAARSEHATEVCLWAVAAVSALLFLLGTVPVPVRPPTHLVLFTVLGALRPLAVIALGVALAFDGRHAQVRRRLERLRSEW